MTPLVDREFLDQFEASFEATFIVAWEILQDVQKAGRAAFAAIIQLHAEQLAQRAIKQIAASIETFDSVGGDEDPVIAGFNHGYVSARDQILLYIREELPTPDPKYQVPAVDWRDDPSLDERWNAGLDFGQRMLCEYLGVNPVTVNWDAATETLDGDVKAVIANILRAHFGEDWGPKAKAP